MKLLPSRSFSPNGIIQSCDEELTELTITTPASPTSLNSGINGHASIGPVPNDIAVQTEEHEKKL